MLQQFLTPATIMVVSVTASTTQGQLLSPEELATIFEACDMALDLNDFKLEIYSYVESRMSFIAPNLSAIVGASVAAKLMGVAGGLTNLSKMPACNVLVLGSQKRTLSGFSSTAVTPPAKQVKPLSQPIDQNRKKRGGRRVRRMKERFAVTELRKQANRMTFGEIEEDAYQDDLGFSSGHIGKAGTGRIRAAQVDEKRPKSPHLQRTLQKNLQRQQVYGGSTTVRRQVSGTASSVAFTPLQGLEIVNPHAAETRAGDSGAKYFSNTAGFLKLQKN
uniref:U4/U6 small nuclear ribonucleoprotein Prp31 n=1 Tax=Ixodes ricinus TaxID=34613 RepID=A0A090XCP2_IXORI